LLKFLANPLKEEYFPTILSKEYAALAEQVKEEEATSGKRLDSIRTEKQKINVK
jgi:hypothetical protein